MAWVVKNLPVMHEAHVWPVGQEDPLEKGMAAHSSVLGASLVAQMAMLTRASMAHICDLAFLPDYKTSYKKKISFWNLVVKSGSLFSWKAKNSF